MIPACAHVLSGVAAIPEKSQNRHFIMFNKRADGKNAEQTPLSGVRRQHFEHVPRPGNELVCAWNANAPLFLREHARVHLALPWCTMCGHASSRDSALPAHGQRQPSVLPEQLHREPLSEKVHVL